MTHAPLTEEFGNTRYGKFIENRTFIAVLSSRADGTAFGPVGVSSRVFFTSDSAVQRKNVKKNSYSIATKIGTRNGKRICSLSSSSVAVGLQPSFSD